MVRSVGLGSVLFDEVLQLLLLARGDEPVGGAAPFDADKLCVS